MSKKRNRSLPREPIAVAIESLAHDGRGVARVEGKTVFVHGALAGERVRCRVSEFSMNGLTVQGLASPVGTPLCIELQLGQKGAFCLCGVVVHRRGSRGSAGVRFLEVSPAQRHELESYLDRKSTRLNSSHYS